MSIYSLKFFEETAQITILSELSYFTIIKFRKLFSYICVMVKWHIWYSNWTATEKTVRWFVTIKAQTSLRIRSVSSATLLFTFWEESSLELPGAKKINFLSSLFSRRDWFETGFVRNPEDRFSRVVACVACSTALGQIFQVQQIIILKTNIMRRLFIGYIRGITLFYCALHRLICLFDLILYVSSIIFQLNRDGSSWVEPVLS